MQTVQIVLSLSIAHDVLYTHVHVWPKSDKDTDKSLPDVTVELPVDLARLVQTKPESPETKVLLAAFAEVARAGFHLGADKEK